MKNLSLALNIVLLVAVIVLYVLYFSNGKSSASGRAADTSAVNLKIAYFNSDSVLEHYDYLKVNRTQIEERTKKLGQEYQNRAIGLQNEIAAYQRNVNSMTFGQAKATEEDLGKKQQNLQMYQQTLEQQLMEEQAKLQKELYDRITNFLKTYCEEHGLQMVLKLDPTSDVFYGGKGLDITQDVIVGLNEEYKNEKGGKSTADSTKTK